MSNQEIVSRVFVGLGDRSFDKTIRIYCKAVDRRCFTVKELKQALINYTVVASLLN